MADNPLQFADFGNALLAGSQAAYYGGKASQEREAEKRRTAAQPFIEPAVRGDMGAFAKVAAGDPTTATAVAQALSRMDASTLAKAKAATDYTTGVTTGLLAAPPADQERLYQMTRADAQAKGMDISRWHANFDAPWVQMQHGIGIGAKDWFNQQQQNQRHATPSGGAPTLGYMPDGKGAASGGAPQPNREQFIQTMMPHAMAVAQATGLDPRLVLAQSALETSFGGAAPGNNYFGIKSHGAPGGQVLATNEAGPGGGMVPTSDSFRTYADPGASARDYAEFLKTNSRYQPVLAAKGLDAQIDAMGRSGYATDPNYATKLRQIVGTLPPAQMPGPPAGLVPNATMAQMPGAPAGLVPSGGPPVAPMPQVSGPSRGVPGPIAQGDTPQADASGTPLPPAGAQQGQLPIQGDFAMEDPKPYGYRMLARVTNGVPVPLQSADGHYIYEDPQTKRTVLYKPRPVEAVPSGYRAGPNGSLVAIPGGPADKSNGAGGPFPGQSVEANALNMLIADGTLTKNQAAQLAAGKTITNPADGSVMFMTPEGLFKRETGQAPAPVAPPTSLNMPAAPGAAPPAQAPSNPGMITITPPKPLIPNNEQARDTGFADRMTNSNSIIATVENQGKSSGGRFKEAVPFGMGNFAQSEDYQKFKQARDDFINAQLRRESGAAIGPSEYTNADKQYFPVPGDSQAVIEQKALNRKIAVEAMVKSAGPAYKPRAAEPSKGGDREKLLNDARAAIQRGADPAAVAKRLKDMGVEGGL